MKKNTDEQIIAGLLAHGTIRAAADSIGMSERAIYNRMKNTEFQALYRAAKSNLIRSTALSINKHTQEAIATIVDVMRDKENSAAVRMQAAQSILSNSAKYLKYLQDNETDVIKQQRSSDWSFTSLFELDD